MIFLPKYNHQDEHAGENQDQEKKKIHFKIYLYRPAGPGENGPAPG